MENYFSYGFIFSLFSELAQQKENFDKRTAEFERTTVAYELIKRSVDDSNLYKDVYAMEKRVETAKQQVNICFMFNC